ncbi:MAG: non-canonical purine NTP pyrophosphatase [Candidatus Yanofskybacteria bacterium]|nr:non-canonical purine NTP pyrophosphatase [Candidatus Yanofskybacteria bacterium]
MKILIATKNPGKAREISFFLKNFGFETVSLLNFANVPEVEETGKTFEENAIMKAKAYFESLGIPTVADDSGLAIDYLNGEPGVKSRRWLGYEMTDQEMIDTALEKLKGVPIEKRTTHLIAVGVYYDGKNTVIERGSTDGYIVEEQKVKCEPGYPFRAIFWMPKFGKLYQDLTHEEHEQINHRKELYTKLADKILAL